MEESILQERDEGGIANPRLRSRPSDKIGCPTHPEKLPTGTQKGISYPEIRMEYRKNR
jgi:hypothetical protein